jgi:hypothetical protein
MNRLSQLEPTDNRLSSIEPKYQLPEEIADKFLLSEKPIHQWFPAEQAEIAKSVLESFNDPTTEAKLQNSLYLSSMFDIPVEDAYALHDQVTSYMLNKQDHPAISILKEIKDHEVKRKNVRQAVADSYWQGGVRSVKGIAGLLKMDAEMSQKLVTKLGLPNDPLGARKKIREWADQMSAGVQEYYRDNPDEAQQIIPGRGFFGTAKQYLERPENIIQGAGESVPMLLEAALGHMTGTAAASYVGHGAKLLPWMGRVFGMSGEIIGNGYIDDRQAGLPPEYAFVKNTLKGITEGVIEEWTLGQKLKVFHGTGSLARRGIGGAVAEILMGYPRGAAEEGTQRLSSNFWDIVFGDPDAKLFKGVSEEAAAGGFMELAMTGAFKGAGKVQMVIPEFIMPRARGLNDMVKDIPVPENAKQEMTNEIARAAVEKATGVQIDDISKIGLTGEEILALEADEVKEVVQSTPEAQAPPVAPQEATQPISSISPKETEAQTQEDDLQLKKRTWGTLSRLPEIEGKSIYRETNAQRVVEFLGEVGTDMTNDRLYFATTPDLALGQGVNKGFVVELDPVTLDGKIDRSKPMAQVVEATGGGVELELMFNSQGKYVNAVKSVTVKPDAVIDKVSKRQFDRAVRKWNKTENPDGSVTYTKPISSSPSSSEAQEIPPAPSVSTGKSMLFKDMEKPKSAWTETKNPYEPYLERAKAKAQKEKKDQYIWFDSQNKPHITQVASPKHLYRRVPYYKTAAEKTAQLQREQEAETKLPRKVRNSYARQITEAIKNHPLYQEYVSAAEETLQRFFGNWSRSLNFGPQTKDVLEYAEGKPYLKQFIAKEGRGRSWDDFAQEMALEMPQFEGITDPIQFMEALDQFVQMNMTEDGFNRKAYAEALRSNDESFAILDTLRDFIYKNTTEAELNELVQKLTGQDNITLKEFLKETLDVQKGRGISEKEAGSSRGVQETGAEAVQRQPGEEGQASQIKEDDDFSDLFEFEAPEDIEEALQQESPSDTMSSMTQEQASRDIAPQENAGGKGVLAQDQISAINALAESRYTSTRKPSRPQTVFRGIKQEKGIGGASYGKGLYTAGNKKDAAEFGEVVELGPESLPQNPMIFDTVGKFNEFIAEAYSQLGYRRISEFNKDFPDLATFIQQLGNYDGVQIGHGTDAWFVKYPPITKKDGNRIIGERYNIDAGYDFTISDVRIANLGKTQSIAQRKTGKPYVSNKWGIDIIDENGDIATTVPIGSKAKAIQEANALKSSFNPPAGQQRPGTPPRGSKSAGFVDIQELADAAEAVKDNSRLTAKALWNFTKDTMEKISFRLENINPKLSQAVRQHAFDKMRRTYISLREVKDFVKAMQKLKKKHREAYEDLSYYLKKNDWINIQRLRDKYKLNNELNRVFDLLADIGLRAEAAGVNIELRGEYFPRRVKDMEKFLEIAYNTPGLDRSIITDALKAKAKRRGIKVEELTEQDEVDTINTLFRGFPTAGISIATPGPAKERQVVEYTKELDEAYYPAEDGLVLYIEEMEDSIAEHEFFGRISPSLRKLRRQESTLRDRISALNKIKAAQERKLQTVSVTSDAYRTMPEDIGKIDGKIYDAQQKLNAILKEQSEIPQSDRIPSIGDITLELLQNNEIRPGQDKEIQRVLKAYFNPGVQNILVRTAMQGTYLMHLGNSVLHNVTQLGEISNPILEDWKTFIPAAARVLTRKELVKHEDIPHRLFGEELNMQGGFGKLVNKVLRLTLGVDDLGKAIHRNTAALKAFRLADNPPDWFINELKVYFGENWEGALKDLQKGEVTDSLLFYVFNRMSDRQPMTGAEMPVFYHTLPNIARPFFYAFKSFQINRLNSIIQNANRERKAGNYAMAVLTTAYALAVYLAFDTSMDVLKDIIRGKEIDEDEVDDYVIDNALRMVFMSKYMVDSTQYKTPSDIAADFYKPAIWGVVDDAWKSYQNEDPYYLEKYIPLIGSEIYNAEKEERKGQKRKKKSPK